jgi:hypothetical protein
MSVPTHQTDCQTQLWRTFCPDCHERVYFFSCSCGSKVYFNLNQPPWNPHGDRCIPYLVRILTQAGNFNPAQVLAMIDTRARELDLPIPPDLERRLVEMARRARPGLIVHEVLPDETGGVIVARVHEINLQVNFFKRFNLADTSISRSLLGQLAREAYVEITIRSDPEPGSRDSHQWHFFCPRRLYDQVRPRQRSEVWVMLQPHQVPGHEPIWLAESVEVIV